MSVIIRLQGLALSAQAVDIRKFFQGLHIPAGGVHIIGGEKGDAFIAFSTDEDARQAMMRTGQALNGELVQLFLSSKSEMQMVIEEARGPPPEKLGQGHMDPVGMMQQQQQQQPPYEGQYDDGYGRGNEWGGGYGNFQNNRSRGGYPGDFQQQGRMEERSQGDMRRPGSGMGMGGFPGSSRPGFPNEAASQGYREGGDRGFRGGPADQYPLEKEGFQQQGEFGGRGDFGRVGEGRMPSGMRPGPGDMRGGFDDPKSASGGFGRAEDQKMMGGQEPYGRTRPSRFDPAPADAPFGSPGYDQQHLQPDQGPGAGPRMSGFNQPPLRGAPGFDKGAGMDLPRMPGQDPAQAKQAAAEPSMARGVPEPPLTRGGLDAAPVGRGMPDALMNRGGPESIPPRSGIDPPMSRGPGFDQGPPRGTDLNMPPGRERAFDQGPSRMSAFEDDRAKRATSEPKREGFEEPRGMEAGKPGYDQMRSPRGRGGPFHEPAERPFPRGPRFGPLREGPPGFEMDPMLRRGPEGPPMDRGGDPDYRQDQRGFPPRAGNGHAVTYGRVPGQPEDQAAELKRGPDVHQADHDFRNPFGGPPSSEKPQDLDTRRPRMEPPGDRFGRGPDRRPEDHRAMDMPPMGPHGGPLMGRMRPSRFGPPHGGGEEYPRQDWDSEWNADSRRDLDEGRGWPEPGPGQPGFRDRERLPGPPQSGPPTRGLLGDAPPGMGRGMGRGVQDHDNRPPLGGDPYAMDTEGGAGAMDYDRGRPDFEMESRRSRFDRGGNRYPDQDPFMGRGDFRGPDYRGPNDGRRGFPPEGREADHWSEDYGPRHGPLLDRDNRLPPGQFPGGGGPRGFEDEARGIKRPALSESDAKYVYVENMPFSFAYRDVRRTFHGCEIPYDGLKMINDSLGRRTGCARIKFASPEAASKALTVDGQMVNNRKLRVTPSNQQEFEEAVDSYLPENGPAGGPPPFGKRPRLDEDPRDGRPPRMDRDSRDRDVRGDRDRGRDRSRNSRERGSSRDRDRSRDSRDYRGRRDARMDGRDPREEPRGESRSSRDEKSDKNSMVAQLKGFTPSVTKSDVQRFLGGIRVSDNGNAIYVERDEKGLCTGIVMVELSTYRDFRDTLNCHGRKFGPRNIDVSVGKKEDLRALVEKQKEGPKPAGPEGGSKEQAKPGDSPAKPPQQSQPPAGPGDAAKNQSPTKQPGEANGGKDLMNFYGVHLQGLPALATFRDLKEFFKDLSIAPRGMQLVHDGAGKPLGEGFVEFTSLADRDKAVLRNKMTMGRHVVNVRISTKMEMVETLRRARNAGGPSMGPGSGPGMSHPELDNPIPPGVLNNQWFYLRCNNFPTNVTIGEIMNFFRGYNAIPESIRLHYSGDGSPTGNAVVGFMNKPEGMRAMQELNQQPCKGNLITLSQASY